MKIQWHRWFILVVIGLTAWTGVTPAQASRLPAERPGSTRLEGGVIQLVMEPLKPIALGEHPTIVLHLTDHYGKPLPNQVIRIFINGARKADAKTDSKGMALAVLHFNFTAGTYKIKAVYYGILSLGVPAVSVQANLVVQSTALAIETVPPLVGISLRFNDQVYTSGQDGIIRIPVEKAGVYAMEVLPVDPSTLPPNTRIEFARWNDEVVTPARKTYIPRDAHLKIGMVISHQIRPAFFDPAGRPVDPARIDSITLKRLGEILTLDGGGPVWLPANRIVRRMGGELESKELAYSFSDVVVDGANVVNRNQQRLKLTPGEVWPVNLLVYSVRFSARDAMFHTPIGKGVELTFPDGRKEEFYFSSPDAELIVPSLARGSYTARIIGAGGSAPPTPIHLSRDQGVELLMLSYLDMGLLVGLPLLVTLVFFFIGRPYWLRALRHPSKLRELVIQQRTEPGARISSKS